MPKLRVYQLARELNRDNSEIIRELQHMGVPVTSHSNTVEDRLADRLRKELGVFTPEAAASATPADEIVAVEEAPAAPVIEVAPPPQEPVPSEAEAPRIEAKAEPKVEPKIEEKAPAPEAKVAAPPVVTAPPAPPVLHAAPSAPRTPSKIEQPVAAQPLTTPSGGRILPPPTRIGPA